MTDQTVPMPLRPGSEVEIRNDDGYIIFQDVVEQYVPETGLLVFERCDVGYAEFTEMAETAGGYEVTNHD